MIGIGLNGDNVKIIKYLIKSFLIGTISILLINLIGQFWNFEIPFNFINVALIGFFYLPGLILVLLILLL